MNTCKDCIKAQADIGSIKYVRYDDETDIMIVACQKHLTRMAHSNLMMEYETLEEVRQNSIKDATRK